MLTVIGWIRQRTRWQRVGRTLVSGLTVPFYWVLHWGAEPRALQQAYRKQRHWEKTTHDGRNGPAADGGRPMVRELPSPVEGGRPAIVDAVERDSSRSSPNTDSDTAGSDSTPAYTLRGVHVGIFVLAVGLLFTIGLPLLLV